MKGHVNNTIPELKAFKQAPILGLSQWENGNLTTNLAETKDTNGARIRRVSENNVGSCSRQCGCSDGATPAAVQNVFELASDYGIQSGD